MSTDTTQTSDPITAWCNQCCLTPLELDKADRPPRWTCDGCGADWRYDGGIDGHVPGHGLYWQHEAIKELASTMGLVARSVDRIGRRLHSERQYTPIMERPPLSRWQHLKAALKL